MMRKILIIQTIIILSTTAFAQNVNDSLVEYADSVFSLFHKNQEIEKDTLHISRTKLYLNNNPTKDSVNIFTYYYTFSDFEGEFSFFKGLDDSLYLNEPDAVVFYLLNEISKKEKAILSTYDGIIEEYSEKGQSVADFEGSDFFETSGFYTDLIIHDKEYGEDQFDLYLSLVTHLDPIWGWRRVDLPAREMKYETFLNKVKTKEYDKYKVRIIFRGASKMDKYDIKRIRVAFFNLYNNELIGDGIVSKKLKVIRD